MTTGKFSYVAEMDVEKALARMNKLIAKMESLDQKTKKVSRSGKKASATLGRIAGQVTGMLSLASAIGLVTRALTNMSEVRVGAAGTIASAEESYKNLLQVAGGSPARMKAFKGAAAGLMAQQGMTLPEALDFVFRSYSLELTIPETLIAGQFKRFSARGAAKIVEAARGLEVAFGKESLGGTMQSRVNAMLAAAKNTKATILDVAENVLVMAAPVKELGGSATEALAALAVTTKGSKNVEMGATVMARLGDVLRRDERFTGKGVQSAIETLFALPEDEQYEILGNVIRARRGAQILREDLRGPQDLKRFIQNTMLAQLKTGTAESNIRGALRVAEQDIHISSLTAKQRAVAMEEIAEFEMGGEQLQRDAVRAAHRADMARRGVGPFSWWWQDMALLGVSDWLGRDPEALAREAGRLARSGRIPGMFDAAAYERDAHLGPDFSFVPGGMSMEQLNVEFMEYLRKSSDGTDRLILTIEDFGREMIRTQNGEIE
jgi:hypothetical protein